jgi:hypothetical protein
LVGVLIVGIRRLRGPAALAWATRVASYSAIVAGAVWFVQRVIVA